MNIFVLEDNKEWRDALVDMYKLIIGKSGFVDSGAGVDDADFLSKNIRFDLLSLDINLGDYEDEGGNGMTILEDVANKGLVNGVVLITSAPHDMNLKAAIPNEKDRTIARVTLGEYAEGWMPGKNIYFQKPIEGSIQSALEAIKRTLTYERLSELASPFIFDDASQTLTFKGRIYRLSADAYSVIKEVHEKGGKVKNDDIEYLDRFESHPTSKLADIFRRGALDTPSFYDDFKEKSILKRVGGDFYFQLPKA